MSRLKSHPYGAFLHEVEKPARYIGGEYNQVVKDPSTVRVQLALAFPDLYDIGMSHLGTKILYKLVNDQPDLLCERAFAPWPDMEAKLREHELPVLSLETHRSLMDFDAVGFSLQYELTFTNMLNVMDLCGIPLHGDERDESHPIVFAGGPVATQPESVAPFVDVFLIGDAEEVLPAALRRLADCKEQGRSRHEILVELAKLEGLYCPSLFDTAVVDRGGFEVVTGPKLEGIPEHPRRAIVENLDAFPFPDDSPVAAAEAIFDRMSVEIARGCTEGCRFCQAGMIYRPVRERDPEQIVDTLVSAMEKGGYDEAGLTTLSTADYSCISPLIKKVMDRLRPEKVSLSIASLRAYGLDEDLLDEISSVRATGLTFAPEAGTQRMRDVVNKNISEDDVFQTAHRVFSRGWKRMKLYFMIGLPTEEDEDVAGIMEMGQKMKSIGREYHGGRTGITVSVSSHVPKPHTPFQWVAMDSMEEIARKQEILFELSRRYRLEFRRHDPRASFLEGIIGRGDRRVAKVIEAAWRKGARFDGWDEHLKWDLWLESIAESEIDPQLYLGTIATDVRLPWDHLDMQLEPKFLLRDYRMSMRDRLAPPCGKPVGAQVHHTNLAEHDADTRKLVCYNCGVACDMSAMREERATFLEKMGALAPADNADTRARREAQQARIDKGSAPHDFQQGDASRVRLQFQKTGADAMTGHLDLVRKLPRILRRAGIPVFYTEGYHPKPAVAFGPALSLGVESVGELAEVKLSGHVDPGEILRRLNAVSEEGLVFTGCRILETGEKGLSRSIARADYLLKLDGLAESGLGSAVVGGGSSPRPGEISLAHNGVLFLDELPEFDRRVLEVLREPLESGRIMISRAAQHTEFPARFQLVAAMNPCPCGYLGDSSGRCHCNIDQIERYRRKISGPLLDRIDMHVEVPRLSFAEIDGPQGESSAFVRARVVAAKDRQMQRSHTLNSQLDNRQLDNVCDLQQADRLLLQQAMERLQLSARAYHRILRVARTIADLAGDLTLDRTHISEAINYRKLDRPSN